MRITKVENCPSDIRYFDDHDDDLENKLKPTASLCLLKRFMSEAAHKTEKNNLLGFFIDGLYMLGKYIEDE